MSTEDTRGALQRIRAHFAAHLEVARIDGNAERERGATALLADLDVLRSAIESTSNTEENAR